jgi:hypothetical protein
MSILTKLLALGKVDARFGEPRASEESDMSQGGHERGVKIEFERPPVQWNERGVPFVNPGDILRSRAGQEVIRKFAEMAREQEHLRQPAGK